MTKQESFSRYRRWPATPVYLLLAGALLMGLSLGGCAGHEHYFQPDARVGVAPSGSPDSALVTAGRHYAAHGWLHRWTFGAHYRSLWALPVVLPVLRLPHLPGHPTPTELGGGYQTTSVTIADSADHRWVVRTIDKDPYRTLPKALRSTFVLRLVRDETAAANPFAPLALPVLSRAAGVPYTSPKLYYVAADDSAFDRLTPHLRGKVVLLEEKFSGETALRPPDLTTATGFVDSDVALCRRFSDPQYRFDALAFARARLFDLWINDWDRHEGQWNWAVLKVTSSELRVASDEAKSASEKRLETRNSQPESYRYVPIPKDRDQTFFRFDDGWLTWLASRRFTIRKLRTMHAHYDDVPSLAWNARFLDARVLTSVTAAQFDSLARDLQTRLPDSVIDRALHVWPPTVYALEGARTAALLRARRDALPQAARAFYAYLAKEPLVVGTDAAERFDIERTADGRVTISISTEGRSGSDEKTRFVHYRRTFSPAETRQLRVYGLGDKDEFVVHGPAPRQHLPILIYGGEGEDKLSIATGASAKGIKILDTKRGVALPEKPDKSGLKRNLAGRGKVEVNAFDREGL